MVETVEIARSMLVAARPVHCRRTSAGVPNPAVRR